MQHVMEVLDASGHVELTWTPGDAESEATARAEFDRLKAAGFAFFSTPGDDAEEVMGWPTRGRPPAWTKAGTLDVRTEPIAEQTTEFRPYASRTVAVRPMRGG